MAEGAGPVATVMVLSGLMLLVALTMASTTIFSLSATTSEGNMAIAEDLAESALQEAIAKLASDNTYGEGTTPPPPIVVSDPALPPRPKAFSRLIVRQVRRSPRTTRRGG